MDLSLVNPLRVSVVSLSLPSSFPFTETFSMFVRGEASCDSTTETIPAFVDSDSPRGAVNVAPHLCASDLAANLAKCLAAVS